MPFQNYGPISMISLVYVLNRTRVIPKALRRIIGLVRKIYLARPQQLSSTLKENYSMRDKTESNAPENSEPFFARFLEGQDSSKDSFMTLKYPSDRDEIDWNPYSANDQQ